MMTSTIGELTSIHDIETSYLLMSLAQPCCLSCGVTKTPMWRRGVSLLYYEGVPQLHCNACGIRWSRRHPRHPNRSINIWQDLEKKPGYPDIEILI